MLFEFFLGRGRTSLLAFNDFVIFERRAAVADALLLSFNTFSEIDLVKELEFYQANEAASGVDGAGVGGADAGGAGRGGWFRRLTQLSFDDGCTVFCGVRTVVEGVRSLGVAVAHCGRLIDITDRTVNLCDDGFAESSKLKIYDTGRGKIAVLVDTDAALASHWGKIAAADCVFCFTTNDNLTSQISALATQNNKPTIILSQSKTTILGF